MQRHNGDAAPKLSSGEITVGMANRLTIESRGKFQTHALRGRPDVAASRKCISRKRQKRCCSQPLKLPLHNLGKHGSG